MLWHSLKTGFSVIVLVLLAGCSGVNIGALDSRVDTEISSVAVWLTRPGAPVSSITGNYAAPYM